MIKRRCAAPLITARFFPVTEPEIMVCRNADELAWRAAERFVTLAQDAVAERGRFTVVLSGGSTPKPLYSLLASAEFAARIPPPTLAADSFILRR